VRASLLFFTTSFVISSTKDGKTDNRESIALEKQSKWREREREREREKEREERERISSKEKNKR
jgi:hypothetical protein